MSAATGIMTFMTSPVDGLRVDVI